MCFENFPVFAQNSAKKRKVLVCNCSVLQCVYIYLICSTGFVLFISEVPYDVAWPHLKVAERWMFSKCCSIGGGRCEESRWVTEVTDEMGGERCFSDLLLYMPLLLLNVRMIMIRFVSVLITDNAMMSMARLLNLCHLCRTVFMKRHVNCDETRWWVR